MLKTKKNKLTLQLVSFRRMSKPGARATTRAQSSCDKLLNSTTRRSSCNMRRDRKLNNSNKRSSNTKKSRLRDAGKKRLRRDNKPMSKPIKLEKREQGERPRKKLLPRRESKKPENGKRRKRLPRRQELLKLRKKPPRLPASKHSKPFQTHSLTILT